jgi:hypothetical protein
MTAISPETKQTLIWSLVLFPVALLFGLLFGNPHVSSNLVLVFIGIGLGFGFFCADALYGMVPGTLVMLIGFVLEFLWVLLWVMIVRLLSRKFRALNDG